MPPFTRTIREQVTNKIRDDVVSGNFESGERLRENDLAKKFGVSRGPVRDAFLQLAQEGFLAYEANRGVTVRQPPKTEHRELIVSLRRQIEEAVILGGVERLDDKANGVLSGALRDLEIACSQGEVGAVARCDIAFHQAILEQYDGEALLPVWKWLCSQMLLQYTRLDDYQQVYAEHVEIYEALVEGRKRDAVSAIMANIR